MSGFLSKVFLNLINNERGMEIAYKAYYLNSYLNWCKKNTSPFVFRKKQDMYRHLIEKEGFSESIDYLEFGVAAGATVDWWTKNNTDVNSSFTGFDTFTGLPETWKGSMPKGAFDQGGKIPNNPDPRCKFEAGLFQDTLPQFLQKAKFKNRKLINMDADLYSSTLFVLLHLAPILNKGDVIMFDEFNDLKHEFKALMDFNNATNFELRLIAITGWLPYKYKRVALEVVENKAP